MKGATECKDQILRIHDLLSVDYDIVPGDPHSGFDVVKAVGISSKLIAVV